MQIFYKIFKMHAKILRKHIFYFMIFMQKICRKRLKKIEKFLY